jgi:predicted nucleic acid-binding protein
VIFLDTSAIYALVDKGDVNYRRANELFEQIIEERLLTHSYVITESISLIQKRLGLALATSFEMTTRNFEVLWVTEEIHREAVTRWASGRRTLSFVDTVSFVVMKRHGIDTAFAFDSDFVAAGFNVLHAVRRP